MQQLLLCWLIIELKMKMHSVVAGIMQSRALVTSLTYAVGEQIALPSLHWLQAAKFLPAASVRRCLASACIQILPHISQSYILLALCQTHIAQPSMFNNFCFVCALSGP